MLPIEQAPAGTTCWIMKLKRRQKKLPTPHGKAIAVDQPPLGKAMQLKGSMPMKRLALATFVLALVPAVALAQDARQYRGGAKAGDHEITLSGTGSNNNDFDSGNFGVSGSYGYYFTPALEVSLRQSLNWSGAEDSDDSWNAATRVAVDYHFNTTGRFRPFIGANIGYIYGDSVNETGTIGPEVGLKYFVNDTTFFLVQTEYQWFFEDSDVGDQFDDGAFQHTIGLGFVF